MGKICGELGTRSAVRFQDRTKVTPDDFGYALEANDDLQKLIRNAPYRWILNGHSHRQMIRDFNGVTIVNAGTLRRTDAPCFFELDFETSIALQMDYLLSWNCTHIANATLRGKIETICRTAGFVPPVICTPLELVEE